MVVLGGTQRMFESLYRSQFRVEVRLKDDKVVTTSGDALHLLRLIRDTPLHEGNVVDVARETWIQCGSHFACGLLTIRGDYPQHRELGHVAARRGAWPPPGGRLSGALTHSNAIWPSGPSGQPFGRAVPRRADRKCRWTHAADTLCGRFTGTGG
jgi:hypothetical protein